MPWIIENKEELKEFEEKIKKAKEILSQERHKRERENFENILGKILEAIERESKKESDPPEIERIKNLLEKLKERYLAEHMPKRNKELLDSILRNLDSADPVEFKALESFVREIFGPILRDSLKRWDQERNEEASLEMILDHLIEKGLKKI